MYVSLPCLVGTAERGVFPSYLPSFLSCGAVFFYIFDSLVAVAVGLEAENDTCRGER
jgi:hypothetical protein